MSQNIIEIKNLEKSFEKQQILKNILSVYRKTVYMGFWGRTEQENPL